MRPRIHRVDMRVPAHAIRRGEQENRVGEREPVEQSPVAAVVLAAGRSRRMGSPKPVVSWKGRPAALHLAKLLGPCPRRLLVIRSGADWLSPEIEQVFELVINPDPERGMLSSVQCALALLEGSRAPVLVTPVDCLGFGADTVRSLIEDHREHCRTAIPVWEGNAGHPVLLAAGDLPIVLAADPRRTSLRDLLGRLPVMPRRVVVHNPGILSNFNTPRDLERADPGTR